MWVHSRRVVIYRANSRLAIECWIIFLLGLLIFTSGLGDHEFVQFESRFGLFAEEMLRNGWSFFPTAYNKFYPDYPATQTIITYLLSLPLHKVTIVTAVLPTATASALTLVFIYLIGALHSKRYGLYGVIFALFSFTFLEAARSISLDQFTTASTAFCFYCAYSAAVLRKRPRIGWIALAWIIGFAFRGPIGMIIPASIVGSFYLLERDFKTLFQMIAVGLILFIICMSGLLSAAWYTGGTAFMHEVIGMQAIHRLESTPAVPFYYYFVACFSYYAITFPLAIIVLAVYTQQFMGSVDNSMLRLLRHLAIWIAIILVGMSIPIDKKMRYILAITPAIALAAAYIFVATDKNKLLNRLRKLMVWFCEFLPGFSFIGLVGIGVFSYYQHLSLFISYVWLGIAFLLLFMGKFYIAKKITGPQQREFAVVCLGLAAFILLYSGIVQPIDVEFNRTKPFVAQVEAVRQAKQAIVFYQIGPDGEDIKFMVALDKPVQPVFLQTWTALLQFTTPAVFIAKDDDFNSLPDAIKTQFNVLFIGRIGHQACVVFVRR